MSVNQSTDEKTRDEAVSRRAFITGVGAFSLGVAATSLLDGCGGGGGSSFVHAQGPSSDQQIVNAAAVAEALATTMYANIISSNIYTAGLATNPNDQAYFQAALAQEIVHYKVLTTALGAAPVSTGTAFYFPPGMFPNTSASYQTVVNTLVQLEEAFIAAYLIGIRDFSSPVNKVHAGQILGVEAEHRALARVVTSDVGLNYTVDLHGNQEADQSPSSTANNLAFEWYDTDLVPNISAVVSFLKPFFDGPTAATKGYVAAPITFNPSTTTTVTLNNSGAA